MYNLKTLTIDNQRRYLPVVILTCLAPLLLALPMNSYADVFRKCTFEVQVEGQNLPNTKIESSQFTAWSRHTSGVVHTLLMHEALKCVKSAYSAEDSAKITKACEFNPLVHEKVDGVEGISAYTLTKARSAMKETICKAYQGSRVGIEEQLTIPSFAAYLKKTSGNGSCPKQAFIKPFELKLMCNSNVSNTRDNESLWRHKSEANKLAQQHGFSDLINGGGNCLSAHQNDYYARKERGKLGMGDCNGLANQKWSLTQTGQLKMLNGQCLERQYYSGTPKLQLSHCNGNINEKWHYDGQFIIDDKGKCLSIRSPHNDLRRYDAKISVRTCKLEPGYTWQSELTPNMKPKSEETTQAPTYLGVELMHATGKCLTINAEDFEQKKNNARVYSETCKKSKTQRWHMTPANEVKAQNGQCLEIPAGSHSRQENAIKVSLSNCNGRAHQQWSYSRHRLRSTNGKCLAMYSKDMWHSIGKAQVWDCNHTLMQKWRFADDFTPLANDPSNKGYMCLTAKQPSDSPRGAKLQIHRCNRQVNQQWYLTPEGHLVNTSGRCLTVHKTGVDQQVNGTKVKMTTCKNNDITQQWRKQKQQLVAGNGMCLSVDKTEHDNDGVLVHLRACNNSSQQQWGFID